MPKALYGFLGEPRTSMLLKQISDLQAKVAELEKALEAAEADVIALRAVADSKVESHKLDDVRALA